MYVGKECEIPEGPIKGEAEFLGKGVYYTGDDPGQFKDKRVLVSDRGERSAELAVELSKHTGRVIFMTVQKESSLNQDMKKTLKKSDVKVLFESELMEVMGEGEVEKVLVNDLDEDQTYELFVDAVVILQD